MRYWLSMNSAALHGGAVAVKAAGALGTASATGIVPAMSLQQMGVVFLGGFAWGMIDWLDRNPLNSEPRNSAPR